MEDLIPLCDFCPNELISDFWLIFKTALGSAEMDNFSANERADCALCFEKICELIKAIEKLQIN